MQEIPAVTTEYRCPCGAQRNKSNNRCRKCAARGRWFRRKAWRSHKSLNRRDRSAYSSLTERR
jgi:hypothetical protein